MNKYIVAYISFFENELVQVLVEATSEREAMLKYLAQYQDIVFEEQELLSMESASCIMDACFNMDSVIVAYKLD